MVSAKNHLPEQVLYIKPPSMRNHYFFLKKKNTVIRSWFVSYRETTKRLFHKNLYKFCLTFRRNILYISYLSLILDCTLLLPSSWSRRRKGASAWIASSLWNNRSPNFWTIKSCFLHVVKLIFWAWAPFIIIEKSMVITELAVSRKLRWCRDLLAAMHMLKKKLLANSKLYYQPLFGKWACAPSPNRRLDARACYCQLPPTRSLPAQIEHAALINFSWSRFKKGDWCGLRSCFRSFKKKEKKKNKEKKREKRKVLA